MVTVMMMVTITIMVTVMMMVTVMIDHLDGLILMVPHTLLQRLTQLWLPAMVTGRR
jgi:hypothetical protein